MIKRIVILTALFLPFSIFAGDSYAPKNVVEYDDPVASPWHFELSLPAWAAWTEGTLSIGDISATGNYAFDEAVRDLDGVAALNFAVKHNRLGYKFNFLYMSLSPGRTFPNRILLERAAFELEQTKIDQYITYDVIDENGLTVSLGGGLRYSGTDSTLTVKTIGPRFNLSRSSETDLLDAVFAGEVRYSLGEKAFLRVFGDIGGTDSSNTWQIMAGGGYFLNDRWYLSLDYRHFEQEYSRGLINIDVEQKGPQVGLNFVF